MDWKKLIDLHYLFSPYPQTGFSKAFLLFFSIITLFCLLSAIIAQIKIRQDGPYKRWYKKIVPWGYTMFIVGFFLIFFRLANAMYLSARFYILLWLIALFAWLIYLIYYRLIILPRLIKSRAEHEEFKKWLPKTKK